MATVQDCIDGLHVICPAVQEDQAFLDFRRIRHETLGNGGHFLLSPPSIVCLRRPV